MISLIAAHDINLTIGLNGDMPWGKSLSKDLQWFRQHTENKVIIMGRRTAESIGRPLPNRINVILTTIDSSAKYYREKICYVAHSVEEILSEWVSPDRELMIIGGSEIYRQFLPFADRLYITHIDHEFEGDTYFPEYDLNDYTVIYERPEENSGYEITFKIYERIKTKKCN